MNNFLFYLKNISSSLLRVLGISLLYLFPVVVIMVDDILLFGDRLGLNMEKIYNFTPTVGLIKLVYTLIVILATIYWFYLIKKHQNLNKKLKIIIVAGVFIFDLYILGFVYEIYSSSFPLILEWFLYVTLLSLSFSMPITEKIKDKIIKRNLILATVILIIIIFYLLLKNPFILVSFLLLIIAIKAFFVGANIKSKLWLKIIFALIMIAISIFIYLIINKPQIFEAKPTQNISSVSGNINQTVTPTVKEKTMNLTIIVPLDLAAYEKIINQYVGSEEIDNIIANLTFVPKQVTVPWAEDYLKASAAAAAAEIKLGGGSEQATVEYFKVDYQTAYILLNIDLPGAGYAGVSLVQAKIHPLVEKTLLDDSNIKQVIFDYAPGEDSTRLLIRRDQLDNYLLQLPDPCDIEQVQANNLYEFQETAWTTYANPQKGLEIKIPYNPDWGSPRYKLNLYDETGNKLLYDGIFFGGEGCIWTASIWIEFQPAESKTALLKRLEKEKASLGPDYSFEIKTFKIDDKEVVQYTKGELCGGGEVIVIGRKYNYSFQNYCGGDLREDMIKTMKIY